MNRPNVTNRRPNVSLPSTTPLRDVQPDHLLDLQCDVLTQLEDANHPMFEVAQNDPALGDMASDTARQAWLDTYRPLTTV